MKKMWVVTGCIGAVFVGVMLATTNVLARGSTGAGCALSAPDNERMDAAKQTAVNNVTSTNPEFTVEDFSCQNTRGISSSLVETRCVTGLCSGGRNIRCCIPGTAGVRPVAGGEAPSGGGASATRVRGGLVLPACVSDGKCTLDDIIQTGVNFANFLFGISGAVFLAIFVYAGILYLTSGGSAERAGKGKKMQIGRASCRERV